LGYCRIKRWSWQNLKAIWKPREAIEEKSMIRIAGYMAQCLYHKRKINLDYHVAEWVVTRDQFADDPEQFERLLGRTWALLVTPENRRAAELMVNALLRSKRLTGRQLQRIYDRTRNLTNRKETEYVRREQRTIAYG
jgi:hypothetical protein